MEPSEHTPGRRSGWLTTSVMWDRRASEAALAAAGAAFLHPLAKATQVKHILGSTAHASWTLPQVSKTYCASAAIIG